MTGNNPTDRSKLGTKRHILTDKNGIPLSTIITSASTHDIKAVTNVIDNSISYRPAKSSVIKKKRRLCHHLCLDKAYSSKSIENEIIRRGYVTHISYKRKRGQVIKNTNQKTYYHSKNKRWVVEREQIHDGIIDSESCLQDMKRNLRTILD